ncbi:MAG: hypothetical protein DLM67_06820 [Candidatus Nephthysia bennettiae]|nr:MAG: hypothetical protein DLM67_06820 [Candidatus Dormibacteraeota bacterium]
MREEQVEVKEGLVMRESVDLGSVHALGERSVARACWTGQVRTEGGGDVELRQEELWELSPPSRTRRSESGD